MEVGTVERLDITVKMREAYLDYAMSVITARALPDVRDGLKPVQRRILYAMYDMGLRHNQPYKKSARIVGEVLGKYHPHGDEPVYEAMVRMAQDFSMRYPLVDGQGNFGSVDGDNAAAMRYTEARLAAIAEEMLADIDKDTVDFIDNFDGSMKEPSVLPSRIPNLLLNGASGIAVGMATNIPPHNLGELCDAIIYLIDRYDSIDEVTVDDLMRYLPGPDFPTGGIIVDREGIRMAYATGKGQFTVRSRVHTEDLKGGRSRIVITELPYQVNKASLIERIADLVRNHRIETISDLRDESDRQGMRIVIELKRGEDAEPTLEELFKHTAMQVTFGVNMLALVEMAPRLLPLKRILQLFIEHRQSVLTRRAKFELERAKLRAHILEGLKIALDHLDEVIETIRRSQTADTAMTNLMRKFKLSEVQARAILDMQLRRLAALERKKIEDEYTEVVRQIAYLEDLLANPRKVLQLIQEDMRDLKRTFGDSRRTHIAEGEVKTLTAGDLVPDEEVLVALTKQGRLGRLSLDAFLNSRATKLPVKLEARDTLAGLIRARSRDMLLCFSSSGQVFQERVHRLAMLDDNSEGQPINALFPLGEREEITALLAVGSLDADRYVTMATRAGRIKRVAAEEFAQIPTVGLQAINLSEGDVLAWARLTAGNEEIILVTQQGQAIRFPEDDVRPMGRAAAGVWAIKLAEGDALAAMDIARAEGSLMLLTERGYGKRSALSEYPTQGRYGSGVRTMDVSRLQDTGMVGKAAVVGDGDQLLIATTMGRLVRVEAGAIPQVRRDSWGTVVREGKRVVELKEGERISALVVLEGKGSAPAGPVQLELVQARRAPKMTRSAKQSAGKEEAKPVKSRSAKGTAERVGEKTKSNDGASTARVRKQAPKAAEEAGSKSKAIPE